VLNNLESFGVKVNVYTSLTEEDLAIYYDSLKKSIVARRQRFHDELAKQVASDGIAKEFASIAESFSKDVLEKRQNIAKNTGALEERLDYVDKEISATVDRESVLSDLEIKESQVISTNNIHTLLKYKDIAAQWAQYKDFLIQKKQALSDQLLLTQRRGVTPQQVSEISESFAKFDEDHDGYIDKRELRQCLYSVGEEKELWEVEDIISKYGDKENWRIGEKGFKELMIMIFGYTDSKDQVLESLELMAKGENQVKVDVLKSVMNPGDLDYFVKTAPQKEENVYDYKTWTDDVFAR